MLEGSITYYFLRSNWKALIQHGHDERCSKDTLTHKDLKTESRTKPATSDVTSELPSFPVSS